MKGDPANMRRKAMGAILLPLPFAALPAVAVLIGAVFGPQPEEQLVTREISTVVSFQERMLTEQAAEAKESPDGLAKVSSSVSATPGCDDKGFVTES